MGYCVWCCTTYRFPKCDQCKISDSATNDEIIKFLNDRYSRNVLITFRLKDIIDENYDIVSNNGLMKTEKRRDNTTYIGNLQPEAFYLEFYSENYNSSRCYTDCRDFMYQFGVDRGGIYIYDESNLQLYVSRISNILKTNKYQGVSVIVRSGSQSGSGHFFVLYCNKKGCVTAYNTLSNKESIEYNVLNPLKKYLQINNINFFKGFKAIPLNLQADDTTCGLSCIFICRIIANYGRKVIESLSLPETERKNYEQLIAHKIINVFNYYKTDPLIS